MTTSSSPRRLSPTSNRGTRNKVAVLPVGASVIASAAYCTIPGVDSNIAGSGGGQQQQQQQEEQIIDMPFTTSSSSIITNNIYDNNTNTNDTTIILPVDDHDSNCSTDDEDDYEWGSGGIVITSSSCSSSPALHNNYNNNNNNNNNNNIIIDPTSPSTIPINNKDRWGDADEEDMKNYNSSSNGSGSNNRRGESYLMNAFIGRLLRCCYPYCKYNSTTSSTSVTAVDIESTKQSLIIVLLLVGLVLLFIGRDSISNHYHDIKVHNEQVLDTLVVAATNDKKSSVVYQAFQDAIQNSNTNSGNTNTNASDNTTAVTRVITIHNKTYETFHELFMPISNGFCNYIRNAVHSVVADNNNNYTTNVTGDLHDDVNFIFDITIDCSKLFQFSPVSGTGNWMYLYYTMRLVALAQRHTSILFTCTDYSYSKDLPKDLVLPWLTGWFPYVNYTSWEIDYDEKFVSLPTFDVACDESFEDLVPIIPIVQQDLRRMAIGLIGPNPGHPSEVYAHQYLSDNDSMNEYDATESIYSVPVNYMNPLLSNNAASTISSSSSSSSSTSGTGTGGGDGDSTRSVTTSPAIELDDVVIHFPCADVFESSKEAQEEFYGFYKFSLLSQHVSLEAKSIGILTQTYDDRKVSDAEHGPLGADEQVVIMTDPNSTSSNTASLLVDGVLPDVNERCYHIVSSFIRHLRDKFSTSNNETTTMPRITVHDSSHDTATVAIARMVMANQTIASASSFSILAGMATFGTAYIPTNNKLQWLGQTRYNATRHHTTTRKKKHTTTTSTNGEVGYDGYFNATDDFGVIEFIDGTHNHTFAPIADIVRIWFEDDGEEQLLEWFQNDTYQLTV